jgi:flagellar hook-associated protein 2
MASAVSTSTATSPGAIQLAGLASGIDWSTLVNELVAAERAPETQMQAQQATLGTENTAWQSIGNDLTTLQSSVKTILGANFFTSRTTSVSDSSVASATADGTAALGTYQFGITQLASDAVQQGATVSASPLSTTNVVSNVVLGTAPFATTPTAGTFTVDGDIVTISTTDTLQDVFNKISTATNGAVTASYNPPSGTPGSGDTITLTSNNSSPIVLGSATDTSNFLQATRLYNNGTTSITSTSALGGLNLTGNMTGSNLVGGISDGGSGNGAFTINGVTINFDASTDSIDDVLNRINDSAAGVTATYDAVNDRFVLTDKSTGDVGISLQDVTGDFLGASGLLGGTLEHGNNLQYKINNGGTLTSQSNTITSDSSGITGLTVNALAEGNVSVTINSDTSTISSAITSLVNSFNAVENYISSQTAVTTSSTAAPTPGILTGDPSAEGMAEDLRNIINATLPQLSGTIESLNDLGIVSNGQDNTLSISNTGTLNTALVNNISAIQTLFTDPTNGLATKLNSYLTAALGTSGTVTTSENTLTQESKDIQTSINTLETKISGDQANLTNEFVNMETAESTINQQKQYLSQYFSSSSSGG